MFCSNCGSSMDGVVTACGACGHSTVSVRDPIANMKSVTTNAFADAWLAIKALARDPIGGIPASFQALGEKRAMSAGIALGAIFAFVVVAVFVIAAWRFHVMPPFKTILGALVLGVVPAAGIAGASATTRAVFRGGGSFASDLFIAGVALQPLAILLVISAILGVANGEVIAILGVLAWTYTIIMLFTGSTRIATIPEKAAPAAVGFMLLISLWLCKIIIASFLSGFNPLGAMF